MEYSIPVIIIPYVLLYFVPSLLLYSTYVQYLFYIGSCCSTKRIHCHESNLRWHSLAPAHQKACNFDRLCSRNCGMEGFITGHNYFFVVSPLFHLVPKYAVPVIWKPNQLQTHDSGTGDVVSFVRHHTTIWGKILIKPAFYL